MTDDPLSEFVSVDELKAAADKTIGDLVQQMPPGWHLVRATDGWWYCSPFVKGGAFTAPCLYAHEALMQAAVKWQMKT